jgi:holo-[acyl-carrier protein] synthase
MIGVDIVEIDRIEELLSDQEFLNRVYTETELAYCHQSKLNHVIAARLATRFAAKEAVFKAIEPLKALRWKEIEVINEESGKPVLHFHGETKTLVEELGIKVDISLSHSKAYAVAAAMLAS